MHAKYGSMDFKENDIENEKEAGNVQTDLSDPCKRRRYWRISQHAVYGLGHIYNDLCAAMWFSYMMLFFQVVLDMRAAIAGAMLLLGQVIDALATPVFGILADKYSTKKTWHLIGSLIVSCTFPMLFIRCWGCIISRNQDYLSWWMPLYYAVLIIFFQIGWAIVQISHLAMIPAISDSLKVRSELTSIRYMASVMSSITVYLITWVVLRATNYSSFIGPSDDYKFRDVSIIVTVIGIFSFVLFHLFFKMNTSSNNSTVDGHSNRTPSLISSEEGETVKAEVGRSRIYHFLQMPLLYQTSLLYVFSRLYWALSLVYVPLFLEERLSYDLTGGSELVASVPLVLYISSFFSSLILKSNISSCGNQVAYFLGSCLSLISCLWIACLDLAYGPEASIVQIYLVAILIGVTGRLKFSLLDGRLATYKHWKHKQNQVGSKCVKSTILGQSAGSSITLVSSLCVTADLIGPHTHQGAAIYSIVTFADKLVTGIAVVSIENYKCDDVADCPQYYRGVLTYACGASAVLGMLSLALTKIMSRRKIET